MRLSHVIDMSTVEVNSVSEKDKAYSINDVMDVLLRAGAHLLACGAHSGRVKRNLERMASTWGYEIHLNSFYRGISLTVIDKSNQEMAVTRYLEAPAPVVHLSTITAVSHLSWRVFEYRLTPNEAREEILSITRPSRPKPLFVAIAVGFSCAGLCIFSNGTPMNAATAFFAAFTGYLAKVFMDRHKYNAFIGIFIAAFITTLITGFFARFNLLSHQDAAIATAVLYLIPGVPLINVVIDMIEGYFTSALNRMLFAFLIVLSIAAGIWCSLTLLGIDSF